MVKSLHNCRFLNEISDRKTVFESLAAMLLLLQDFQHIIKNQRLFRGIRTVLHQSDMLLAFSKLLCHYAIMRAGTA